MTQSKKEIENARRERESQGAFDALQAHEKTYPAMQREYDKLDAECIKLARELAALQLAESPRAEALHGELRLARMTRDGFKYTWNRKRDELTANLEKINEQELQPFRSWVLNQARLLTNKIETKHPRVYIDAEGLRRQIKGETNAPAVKFVRDSLFAGAKRVEELRLQPLEQINIAINEVVAKFENAEFPMEVIELTGFQWRELAAVAAQQESQDRLVYKRI